MNQTKEAMRPLLLEANEAAQAMRICPKTLWTMSVRKRKIPFIKIGRRTLYDPRDLERWIDGQKEPVKTVKENAEING